MGIRESSFGFPQLILYPDIPHGIAVTLIAGVGELVGQTGITTSALRPTGDVCINGKTSSASSEDGQLFEAGVGVTRRWTLVQWLRQPPWSTRPSTLATIPLALSVPI